MRNQFEEVYPVCIDQYTKDIDQRRLINEHNNGNPYVHKCAYCNDYFMYKHQSQKYCPEKFGKVDHCRREQEKSLKRERDAISIQKRLNIARNETIITKIMNGQRMKVVLTDELKSNGYIDSAYKSVLKDKNVFYYHLDNYVIKVLEYNKLLICKNTSL